MLDVKLLENEQMSLEVRDQCRIKSSGCELSRDRICGRLYCNDINPSISDISSQASI